MKKQERVGAVCSIKNGKMKLFGYGIYEGNKIPESDDVKFFGNLLKELGILNPCILLDSGERVYGCECWWGCEEKVKDILSRAKKVINVDIDEVRK